MRDGSAENILGELPAWCPAHLGRGLSSGIKLVILGAEMPVPEGEEGSWYQTRLGVRAEALGSLPVTRPHSLCISPPNWPAGTWHQTIWLAASSSLTHLNMGRRARRGSWAPIFPWLGRNTPSCSGEKCFPRSFKAGDHEKFVIILWISCKPASEGGFGSPLDPRAPVSKAAHPPFLACPPPMQCVHHLEGERPSLEDPGKARFLLGKLCP